MKANLGTHDRAIRMVLGFGFVAAAMLDWIGMWGLIGVLPLLTGIYGVCPAYVPFGLNTCGSNATDED